MTQSRKIAILGAGGHALAVWDACVSAGFEPVGFVDPTSTALHAHGLALLTDLADVDLHDVEIALGIGHNFRREQAANELRFSYPEARLPVVLHQTAWVSPSADLGEGTVVLAQAHVGPMAKTGVGALLNTCASLDHESQLGDFSSLGPGAHTGGNVVIGARTMIGLNAGVLQGVSVGADTVIGAHSLVRQDVPAETVAYGVPCTPVRNRAATDLY